MAFILDGQDGMCDQLGKQVACIAISYARELFWIEAVCAEERADWVPGVEIG